MTASSIRLWFGAHDHALVVNTRTVGFPDFQGALRWEAHADIFNDVQGGIVDLLHFLRGQNFKLELGVGDGFDIFGH